VEKQPLHADRRNSSNSSPTGSLRPPPLSTPSLIVDAQREGRSHEYRRATGYRWGDERNPRGVQASTEVYHRLQRQRSQRHSGLRCLWRQTDQSKWARGMNSESDDGETEEIYGGLYSFHRIRNNRDFHALHAASPLTSRLFPPHEIMGFEFPDQKT
jgi:hypothetical protein